MYHFTRDILVEPKEIPDHANVGGPFYVTNQCTLCGLPPETAPANINYDRCPQGGIRTCRLFKQPESDEELKSVLEAMCGSCVQGIRYRGTNQDVLKKLKGWGLLHLSMLRSESP